MRNLSIRSRFSVKAGPAARPDRARPGSFPAFRRRNVAARLRATIARMKSDASLPLDGQRILELAARSMFDHFANASEGMLLVDRAARVVWINEQYKRFLPALGFERV